MWQATRWHHAQIISFFLNPPRASKAFPQKLCRSQTCHRGDDEAPSKMNYAR